MGIRFDPNSRGIADILMSDDMQKAMMQVAADAKDYAESISPVASGEYRGSFEVHPETFSGPRGERKGAILVNTAEHAADVEWGQEQHVLGQTLAKYDDRG